jgi:hypothetical protein
VISVIAKYYDLWTSREDIDYAEARALPEPDIVYAGYTYEDLSGDAIVVFRKDGKLYENHDCHCSCFGLEHWEPEETSKEAILMRRDDWPGLREAVESFPLNP